MKIVYNKIIPFGANKLINLFGVVFTKSKHLTTTDINHEAIHTAQLRETLYIFFYIWYAIEFLIRWFGNKFNWKKAYKNIWFEQEAYFFEGHTDYLSYRKHYRWFNF